eukprot:9141759-Pyramimonas_sp.AAC.1
MAAAAPAFRGSAGKRRQGALPSACECMMKALGGAMGPLGLLKRASERRGALGTTCGSLGAHGNACERLGACWERARSAWERAGAPG